jgi:hypothetical protein
MTGSRLLRQALEDHRERLFTKVERPASPSHLRERRGDEPEHATGRLGLVGLAESREVVDFYPRERVAPAQQLERLVELEARRQAGHVVDVGPASTLPRCADDE